MKATSSLGVCGAPEGGRRVGNHPKEVLKKHYPIPHHVSSLLTELSTLDTLSCDCTKEDDTVRTNMKHFKLLTYLLYCPSESITFEAKENKGWKLEVLNMTQLAIDLEMQSTRVRRAFEDLRKAGLVSKLRFKYNRVECFLKAPIQLEE